MNRQLISNIIRRRLIAESIFLVEDRIPSLITKYSGMRKIKSHLTPKQIVDGEKPNVKEVPILSTDHDERADYVLGPRDTAFTDEGNFTEFPHSAEKIVRKIAEADPTEGKEYTDRMLHWYSRSGIPRIPISHSFKMPSDNTDRHEEIRQQYDKAIQKEVDEYHSTVHKFKLEDLGRAHAALEVYHSAKNLPDFPSEHKDINKINSLHHLERVVEPFKRRMLELSKSAEDKARREAILRDGAEVLHEDDDVKVYHVKSSQASCELGKGTRWCVSADRNNMFNQYNSDSPLIMFHDKKGKMNQHLDESGGEDKEHYRRYMFSFGTQRNPNVIAAEHGEPIDLRGPHERNHRTVYSDHQLMDESDHDVNYGKFIQTFPQLKHIPALQHLHNYMFQSVPKEQRKQMVTHDPTEFKKIIDHISKYKTLHERGTNTESYIASLLNTRPHTYRSGDERFIGDHDLKEITDHENHPIYTHFFGSSNGVKPKATLTETHSFVAELSNQGMKMHDNVLKRYGDMLKRQSYTSAGLTNESTKNRYAKQVNLSSNPELHEHAYNILGHIKVNPEMYDFMRHTQNQNLIRRAFNDTMSDKFKDVEDKRDLPNRPTTVGKKYIPQTGLLHQLSVNINTPDDILHHLIKNKPIHGFFESPTDSLIDGGSNIVKSNQLYNRWQNHENIGSNALTTLINKMNQRGGM